MVDVEGKERGKRTTGLVKAKKGRETSRRKEHVGSNGERRGRKQERKEWKHGARKEKEMDGSEKRKIGNKRGKGRQEIKADRETE